MENTDLLNIGKTVNRAKLSETNGDDRAAISHDRERGNQVVRKVIRGPSKYRSTFNELMILVKNFITYISEHRPQIFPPARTLSRSKRPSSIILLSLIDIIGLLARIIIDNS